MSRRRRNRFAPFGLVMIIILFIWLLWSLYTSPSNQAKKVVDDFYSYEQSGNFTESWQLFHPYMKEKFSKSSFIQDRAHVFNGHFGAETFSFTISDAEKIKAWKMESGFPTFKIAYHFKVLQTYHGKYGKFSFQQEVYVVKHKKEWVIVWDYNK